MGLKIMTCTPSWGKFWTKDTKRPKNPTATFEDPRAKAGYCTCPLHTTPPKRWANHLSHPSGPTPGHTPALTPYNRGPQPPGRSLVGIRLHSRRWVAGERVKLHLLLPIAHITAWNIPPPHPLPVRGKMVFHETGPWCQKGLGTTAI